MSATLNTTQLKGVKFMNKLIKALFVAIGFISLALGIVGIFLPILPTVPFLLLTSYCFVKGSNRFDTWFKGTNIYKKHLEEFVTNRNMTIKQKITILALASAMLLIPFFMVDVLPMRIFIIVLITGKYAYFIFAIGTIKEIKQKDNQNSKIE